MSGLMATSQRGSLRGSALRVSPLLPIPGREDPCLLPKGAQNLRTGRVASAMGGGGLEVQGGKGERHFLITLSLMPRLESFRQALPGGHSACLLLKAGAHTFLRRLTQSVVGADSLLLNPNLPLQ